MQVAQEFPVDPLEHLLMVEKLKHCITERCLSRMYRNSRSVITSFSIQYINDDATMMPSGACSGKIDRRWESLNSGEDYVVGRGSDWEHAIQAAPGKPRFQRIDFVDNSPYKTVEKDLIFEEA